MWAQEKESQKFWHASSERWEARIQHDGEDAWEWWVAIDNGTWVAEGYTPSEPSDDMVPEDDPGFRQAKAMVAAVVTQAETWMRAP